DYHVQVDEEYIDREKGVFHLWFPISLSTYFLPKALYHFREDYPEAKFELHQGSYSELIESVVNGEINIALLGPVPKGHKKIKSTILFTEDLVALLPNNHFL